MKYLPITIAAVILFSCIGKKPVVRNAPKEEVNNLAQMETTEIQDVVVKNQEEIVAKETGTEELKKTEPVKLAENKEAFNHGSWTDLLQKFVSNQGQVNYKGFKADRAVLKAYINSLSENMPKKTWTKNDKLAYWINAYNAITVDLISRNYPIKSIKDIDNPWEQRLWELGEKWYNLDEIEHQILRKMNEPRIHFAIVCASFSCPKLLNEAFTASNLDEQLTKATKDFLADSKRNEISEYNLKLSKIFQWFAQDFKQNGSLIDFINSYSDIKISSKAKKRFKDYNWDLNE